MGREDKNTKRYAEQQRATVPCDDVPYNDDVTPSGGTVKSVDAYQRDVIKALKAAGTMCDALKMQARSLASALRTVDMANAEIDTLSSTTVLEETRYGQKLAPHPAFKTLRDAQDSVTRQLKILGLTVEDLAGDSEADPMIELTNKVLKASRNPVVKKREPKP